MQSWCSVCPHFLAVLALVGLAALADARFRRSAGVATTEAVGTAAMVVLTFWQGPLLGHFGPAVEWTVHGAFVVAADLVCGSPNVNPLVSVALLAWGRATAQQTLLKVAGQLAGALVGFPLLGVLLGLTGHALGGAPALSTGSAQGHAAAEAGTAAVLQGAILLCCYTSWADGADHSNLPRYLRKQIPVAAALRLGLWFWASAGPAVNPVIGTARALAAGSAVDALHYGVYWVASCAGAAVVTLAFAFATSTGRFKSKGKVSPAKAQASPRSPAKSPAKSPRSPKKTR